MHNKCKGESTQTSNQVDNTDNRYTTSPELGIGGCWMNFNSLSSWVFSNKPESANKQKRLESSDEVIELRQVTVRGGWGVHAG